MIEEIKKPRLNGYSAEEDIRQLKSYLFQLSDQLNRAFNELDAALADIRAGANQTSERGGQ